MSHLKFWHFPLICVLSKLTCLVTLFDLKLQNVKSSPNWPIWHFWSTFVYSKCTKLASLAMLNFESFRTGFLKMEKSVRREKIRVGFLSRLTWVILYERWTDTQQLDWYYFGFCAGVDGSLAAAWAFSTFFHSDINSLMVQPSQFSL